MSELEELLQQYCPTGVEYYKFFEVCEYIRGITYNKNDEVNDGSGGTKVLRANNITLETNALNFDDVKIVSSDVKIKENQWLKKGDVLICAGSGSKEHVGKVAFVFDDIDYSFGGFMGVVRPRGGDLLPGFLFHVLTGNMFKRHLAKASGAVSSTINNINNDTWRNFLVPVPPLPVQREIVRILDTFTELAAELTAELAARKKQYEYYHNALMDFTAKDIGYKSVGELFEIKNGLNKEKEAFGKGNPIINFTDVYNKRWLANGSFKGLVDVNADEMERYSAKKGDVFFTRTSETKEDIGMSSTLIEDVPNCVFSGFVLRARPTTDLLLPKFCSYYFSTFKVRSTIIRYAAFTTRATTTGPKLSRIMVPILPIERQQEIVSILDRLDALCNDVSAGLPAEIEARKKQYEYYRDKLLSFKKSEGR